ncbi:unnamed protein product [Psylliodes chrysocephalus]|uniref:DUF7869 domain-containing protein n=1 Tax=Psylliodes chrysocephalus TaxID=3402493 RepID=A0A9P0D3S3_9CUCU|nr:unnamed protein product [Psylliodes chrysocephala]
MKAKPQERESQEIGSCLFHFIKNLPEHITKIVAYSDACGSQNKNKNISKLFMHIVHTTHIERIDHTFCESGHSYMECDRSFALIKKVHKMDDFLSFKSLNEFVKDPKKDTENQVIKWRQTKWFSYRKNTTYQFFFKSTLQEEFPFFTSEKCTKHVGRPSRNITLEPRNKQFCKIKYQKWENLQQLLDFIPPIFHEFYTGLPHEEKVGRNKKIQIAPSPSASTSLATPEKQEDDGLVSDYD